jgi:hypothetical protein
MTSGQKREEKDTPCISGDPTKGTAIKQHLASQQLCRSNRPGLHNAEIRGFEVIWRNSFLPLIGAPQDWHSALRSGPATEVYHTWIAPSTGFKPDILQLP